MPKISINKPHHKQEHSASCLPACARMILNFLGNAIEEKTLRDLLGTDDYGTSALNMLMLNASIPDTKAEVHIWMLADLLNYLQVKRQPCIVALGTSDLPHWDEPNNLHAIVIHGFDEEHIFINDPFFDEREFPVAIEDFLAAWSEAKNVAITIERR